MTPPIEQRLVEKLRDIYDSLARGYPIAPQSYITGDGKPAIESIGELLRELGQLPNVRHRDQAIEDND